MAIIKLLCGPFPSKFLSTIFRSDESACEKHEKWTYDIFKTCTVNKDNAFGLYPSFGNFGFQCGSNLCVGTSYWCNEYQKIYHFNMLQENCPELASSLVSERLCSNKTFWENIPCREGRCTGNWPGQCSSQVRLLDRVKRAATAEDPCYELNGLCKDKSQLVCDSELEVCGNSTMHLCADQTKCIHNDLVCDGYVQCPDGSDEEDTVCGSCPKNFGYPNDRLPFATFPCRHRYTGRWICSVPCDGHDDLCENFEDENCDSTPKILVVVAAGLFLLLIIILGEAFLLWNQLKELCKRECEDLSASTQKYPSFHFTNIEERRLGKEPAIVDYLNDFKEVKF